MIETNAKNPANPEKSATEYQNRSTEPANCGGLVSPYHRGIVPRFRVFYQEKHLVTFPSDKQANDYISNLQKQNPIKYAKKYFRIEIGEYYI